MVQNVPQKVQGKDLGQQEEQLVQKKRLLPSTAAVATIPQDASHTIPSVSRIPAEPGGSKDNSEDLPQHEQLSTTTTDAVQSVQNTEQETPTTESYTPVSASPIQIVPIPMDEDQTSDEEHHWSGSVVFEEQNSEPSVLAIPMIPDDDSGWATAPIVIEPREFPAVAETSEDVLPLAHVPEGEKSFCCARSITSGVRNLAVAEGVSVDVRLRLALRLVPLLLFTNVWAGTILTLQIECFGMVFFSLIAKCICVIEIFVLF